MQVANKKTALLVIAAVAVLTAVIYAVWAIFLAPPSKQDFVDAKVKAEQIKKYSGTTLQAEFSRKVLDQSKEGDSQQKLIESASSEKQDTINALNARSKLADEVENSRALRDEDVKAAFDTYRAREDRYSSYIKDYLDAFPAYVSSFTTCIDVFEVTRQTTDDKELARLNSIASKDCLEDLNILIKSPITPFSDFAKEFKRIVVERQKVFDGVKDGSIPLAEASASITKLGADFSKNDPTDDIKKYAEGALFNGELNKLIDVLKTKE